MKLFDKIWDNLDGFKTALGGLLHAAWFIYYIFYDKETSLEHQLIGHAIIGIITGVGLWDKWRKYNDNKKQNGKGD